MAANSARNQRGRPFVKGQSGCPAGKPKGARHRTTLAAEALLDGEAEVLTRKAIELALAGDSPALRLCLDRILPPRRERPVRFALPLLPRDLRYDIDFIKVIFHPIRRHRCETVLNSRGVDLCCPPAPPSDCPAG